MSTIRIGVSGNLERLVKPADGTGQGLRNFKKPAGRQAAMSCLVFLDLLEGYAQQGGKAFLRQAQFAPALPQPLADKPVSIGGLARFVRRRSFVTCRQCSLRPGQVFERWTLQAAGQIRLLRA